MASTSGSVGTASRKKAAHRKRRIIFNNDGADAWEAVEPTVEAFLAARSKPCINTQVDSVFYDTTHDTGLYTHRTRIGKTFLRVLATHWCSQLVNLKLDTRIHQL